MMLFCCFLALATLTALELLTTPFIASGLGRLCGATLGARRAPSFLGGRYRILLTGRFAFPLTLFMQPTAITFGTVILVREGNLSSSLERHEAVHVRQYRRFSSLGFWLIYLLCWLWNLLRFRDARLAYLHIPFEMAAHRAQHGEGWQPPT